VAGVIAHMPAGRTAESRAHRDFSFTPAAGPGQLGTFFPFCCRIE